MRAAAQARSMRSARTGNSSATAAPDRRYGKHPFRCRRQSLSGRERRFCSRFHGLILLLLCGASLHRLPRRGKQPEKLPQIRLHGVNTRANAITSSGGASSGASYTSDGDATPTTAVASNTSDGDATAAVASNTNRSFRFLPSPYPRASRRRLRAAMPAPHPPARSVRLASKPETARRTRS
jgi:hypothetical protein